MKFVKGIVIFLVLCLAVRGAYTLLKKPPKLNVSENDAAYLEEIGVSVQNGQATSEGLSGVFNNVEGVPPVGGSFTASSGSSNSVPPSFLGEPVTAPPTVPVPSFEAAPPFESAPSFEAAPPFAEATPKVSHSAPKPPPAVIEPPPAESWDGPVAEINLPPANNQTLPTPPSVSYQTLPAGTANVTPLSRTPSELDDKIAYRPIGRSTRPLPQDSPIQTDSFSSEHVTAAQPAAQNSYVRTSNRKNIVFEPAQPEVQTKDPVVSFAPPRQIKPNIEPQPPSAQPVIRPVPEVAAASKQTERRYPVREQVEQFIQSQRLLIESGNAENIRLAFVQLSRLYDHDQLNDTERSVMLPILDSLALKVIYAKDTHILESPYRVKPGETVESVAKAFSLTPALLRKINSMPMTQELSAGSTVKVVFGQFDAKVSPKRKELTLLLGGLYAGRFPIAAMNMVPMSGDFFVTSRSNQAITLNNGWVLATAGVKNAAIQFYDRDAKEIFDILSDQSVVVLEL